MTGIENLARPEICPACDSSGAKPVRRAALLCDECGTVWTPSRRHYVYDDSYPELRAHTDEIVAHCKQVTLKYWLKKLALQVAGRKVVEVGFGSGSTLALVEQLGATAYGVEPVSANRQSAADLGIAADRLRKSLDLFGDCQFDAALYLDSFEHLLEPGIHLDQLCNLTTGTAYALVVLPISQTLSQKLLGSWWPHDIDDHWIYYSSRGLIKLWNKHGWECTSTFFPWKYISARTVAKHWQVKTGTKLPFLSDRDFGIWLNFGERGFVFQRKNGP